MAKPKIKQKEVPRDVLYVPVLSVCPHLNSTYAARWHRFDLSNVISREVTSYSSYELETCPVHTN